MLTIEEIKQAAEKVGRKHGVERIYLFGSYARGDATEGSDVDFRIDEGDIRTYFQLGGLNYDLEEALGKPVDICLTEGLSKTFRNFIRKDEVLIYERA